MLIGPLTVIGEQLGRKPNEVERTTPPEVGVVSAASVAFVVLVAVSVQRPEVTKVIAPPTKLFEQLEMPGPPLGTPLITASAALSVHEALVHFQVCPCAVVNTTSLLWTVTLFSADSTAAPMPS